MAVIGSGAGALRFRRMARSISIYNLIAAFAAILLVSIPAYIGLPVVVTDALSTILYKLATIAFLVVGLQTPLILLLLKPLHNVMTAGQSRLTAEVVIKARGRFLAFPLFLAAKVLLSWTIVGIFVTYYIRAQFGTGSTINFSIFFICISIGILAGMSVFFMTKLEMSRHGNLMLHYKAGKGGKKHAGRIPFGERISVHAKLIGAFISVLLVAVIFGWVIVLAQTTEIFRRQQTILERGSLYSSIERIRNKGIDEVEDVLRSLNRENKAHKNKHYLFFDEAQNIFIGDSFGVDAKKLIGYISGGHEYYFDELTESFFIFLPVLGNDKFLISMSVGQGFFGAAGDSYGLVFYVFGFGFLALICTGLASFFLARDISIPLSALVEPAKKIAAGNLQKHIIDCPDDEIGMLAENVTQMTGAVKNRLAQIIQNISQGELINAQLKAELEEFVKDEEKVASFIEKTAGFVGNIESKYAGIGEGLAGTISKLNSLISEMNNVDAYDQLFTENNQVLAGAIEEAVVALLDVSSSIRRVSSEIAELTSLEQVVKNEAVTISQKFNRLEKDATESRNRSESLDKSAGDAEKKLEEMRQYLHFVEDAVGRTVVAVREHNSRMLRVDNIIEIINIVSGQTKLLSLNASIIAANGKAEGRNFNVVADEIKDLAERTATSTNEIYDMFDNIRHTGDKISEGVASAREKVGQSLDRSADARDVAIEVTGKSLVAGENLGRIARLADSQERQIQTLLTDINRMTEALDLIDGGVRQDQSSIDEIVKSVMQMKENSASLVESWTLQQRERGNLNIKLAEVLRMLESVTEMLDSFAGQRGNIKQSMTELSYSSKLMGQNRKDLENCFSDLEKRTEELKSDLSNYRIND